MMNEEEPVIACLVHPKMVAQDLVAENARFVVSVCTGSLLLAATGLLVGKKASTHWSLRVTNVLDLLEVKVQNKRITLDGKYLTCAGVTSGIDLGLTIVSLWAETEKEGVTNGEYATLVYEYQPEPPFKTGTPDDAPQALSEKFLDLRKALIDDCIEVAREIRNNWPRE
ncbi:hypothetical protein PPL_02363 [Heterostelium album PN500]|uniref:DJ-1/PfpI domain-containing protein n=1 Tax=Heterostelium pallidum (strain ATCC 26659 / Pp 5 / PN500) TaxID=670386 RepID=D3AZI1_HETP5|nr:hypothetical protein PPL_02363 [Heterostelium album PN500]EFA85360.1 hypothetical protein PPL_02363 [Heterostelium album PN500]|eukprot:XP_020437469.1 hypothetical protein PPL_02363 [Heterostelium album PN500]